MFEWKMKKTQIVDGPCFEWADGSLEDRDDATNALLDGQRYVVAFPIRRNIEQGCWRDRSLKVARTNAHELRAAIVSRETRTRANE